MYFCQRFERLSLYIYQFVLLTSTHIFLTRWTENIVGLTHVHECMMLPGCHTTLILMNMINYKALLIIHLHTKRCPHSALYRQKTDEYNILIFRANRHAFLKISVWLIRQWWYVNVCSRIIFVLHWSAHFIPHLKILHISDQINVSSISIYVCQFMLKKH